MTFQEKIMDKIRQITPDKLTPEERAVMANMMAGMKEGKKLTQDNIFFSERWQALKPKEVIQVMDTEKRQIRQVIRDLRLKFGAPILSDRNGYWIAQTEDEAIKYMQDLEIEAKSTAKAWFVTYHAMKEILNTTSSFFENFNI